MRHSNSTTEHHADSTAHILKRRTIDVGRARIYFTNGHVEHFRNQIVAFAVWLALPKGTRAAFRGKNDGRPVYPWDCVDVLP